MKMRMRPEEGRYVVPGANELGGSYTPGIVVMLLQSLKDYTSHVLCIILTSSIRVFLIVLMTIQGFTITLNGVVLGQI